MKKYSFTIEAPKDLKEGYILLISSNNEVDIEIAKRIIKKFNFNRLKDFIELALIHNLTLDSIEKIEVESNV